jgi:hypothetical protein
MAEYWIRDREARVLGPVGLNVVRDLVAAGRLKDIASISTDGQTWTALADFPGLADLMAAPAPSANDLAAQDQAQAKKLRDQLVQLRALPDEVVFKVPENSSAQLFRSAFFALAKKFHPDRVPDGFPELRAACGEAVEFLSGRMNARVRSVQARPLPQLSPVAQLAPEPAPARAPTRARPPAPEPPPPPKPFDASQFVGLERKDMTRYAAKVRITRESVSMFTQNALVNVNNSGVFLPGRLAPLGAEIDLLFQFSEPTRDIEAKGKVVWENAQDPKYPVGFGVRYQKLRDDDTAFIKAYVAMAANTRR